MTVRGHKGQRLGRLGLYRRTQANGVERLLINRPLSAAVLAGPSAWHPTSTAGQNRRVATSDPALDEVVPEYSPSYCSRRSTAPPV